MDESARFFLVNRFYGQLFVACRCIVTAVTSGYELNQMPGRGALRGQDDHLLPRASRGTFFHAHPP